MFTATLVLAILALVFFFLNLKSGKHLEGLIQGAKQFLAVLPVLVAAFILAGMLEALIPEAFVRQWLASEAGVRGVILGTIGGMILAMGHTPHFRLSLPFRVPEQVWVQPWPWLPDGCSSDCPAFLLKWECLDYVLH